jgi:LPPG:FO 2-phospho-L-lactate transferase
LQFPATRCFQFAPNRTRRRTLRRERALSQSSGAGYPLSDVTAALCHRWQPGVTLLPASDDRVETHVVVDDPANGPKARKAIHFQEWWIRHKGELPAHRFAARDSDVATRSWRR